MHPRNAPQLGLQLLSHAADLLRIAWWRRWRRGSSERHLAVRSQGQSFDPISQIVWRGFCASYWRSIERAILFVQMISVGTRTPRSAVGVGVVHERTPCRWWVHATRWARPQR